MTAHNKSFQPRHFVAGQFLSRGFVVLLRKSIPQNHNLKTAAELGVRAQLMIRAIALLDACLALGLSVFLYRMLPFARGVACDASATPCPPLSALDLLLTSGAPILVTAVLVALAFHFEKTHSRASIALAASPLAFVVVWGAFIAVQSVV